MKKKIIEALRYDSEAVWRYIQDLEEKAEKGDSEAEVQINTLKSMYQKEDVSSVVYPLIESIKESIKDQIEK